MPDVSAMGQHERPRALQGPAHLLGGYVELLLDGVAQLVDALRQRDQPRVVLICPRLAPAHGNRLLIMLVISLTLLYPFAAGPSARESRKGLTIE